MRMLSAMSLTSQRSWARCWLCTGSTGSLAAVGVRLMSERRRLVRGMCYCWHWLIMGRKLNC
uniref:Uncharacterized protein n=1 Tax=Arundo donax TaxID=35708 RepID=A0A0A9H312_ARUDO